MGAQEPRHVADYISTLTEIGGRLGFRLFSLAGTIRTGEDSAQQLSDDVYATCSVLTQLKNILENDGDNVGFNDKFMRDITAIASRCRTIFRRLETEIKDANDLIAKRSSNNGKIILTVPEQVIWPFLQPRVTILQDDLKSVKTNLGLFLATAQLAQAIKLASNKRDTNLSVEEERQLKTLVLSLRRESTLFKRSQQSRPIYHQPYDLQAVPERTSEDQVVRDIITPTPIPQISWLDDRNVVDPTATIPPTAPSRLQHTPVEQRASDFDGRGVLGIGNEHSTDPRQFVQATYNPNGGTLVPDVMGIPSAVSFAPAALNGDSVDLPDRKRSRSCCAPLWALFSSRTNSSSDEIRPRTRPSTHNPDLEIEISQLQAWTLVASPFSTSAAKLNGYSTLFYQIFPLPLTPIRIHDILAQRAQYRTSVLRDLDRINYGQRDMVLSHTRSNNLRLLSVYKQQVQKLPTCLGTLDVEILVWITSREASWYNDSGDFPQDARLSVPSMAFDPVFPRYSYRGSANPNAVRYSTAPLQRNTVNSSWYDHQRASGYVDALRPESSTGQEPRPRQSSMIQHPAPAAMRPSLRDTSRRSTYSLYPPKSRPQTQRSSLRNSSHPDYRTADYPSPYRGQRQSSYGHDLPTEPNVPQAISRQPTANPIAISSTQYQAGASPLPQPTPEPVFERQFSQEPQYVSESQYGTEPQYAAEQQFTQEPGIPQQPQYPPRMHIPRSTSIQRPSRQTSHRLISPSNPKTHFSRPLVSPLTAPHPSRHSIDSNIRRSTSYASASSINRISSMKSRSFEPLRSFPDTATMASAPLPVHPSEQISHAYSSSVPLTSATVTTAPPAGQPPAFTSSFQVPVELSAEREQYPPSDSSGSGDEIVAELLNRWTSVLEESREKLNLEQTPLMPMPMSMPMPEMMQQPAVMQPPPVMPQTGVERRVQSTVEGGLMEPMSARWSIVRDNSGSSGESGWTSGQEREMEEVGRRNVRGRGSVREI